MLAHYNNYSLYASVITMFRKLNAELKVKQLQCLTGIMHQLLDIPNDAILKPAPSTNYCLRGHSMKLLATTKHKS